MSPGVPGSTVAVVLAAGQGARLGGVAKALLRRGERSFLGAIVDTAAAAGVAQVIVVVGAPFGDEVAAEAGRLGATVCVNPAPARGMASSVACGFAALRTRDVTGPALLWPVDHPAVEAATVTALLAAAGDDLDIIVPRFDDRGGHPVVVAVAVWDALAGCTERPDGAREVLRDRRWRRRDLAVLDPAVIRDVDTRDDLPAGW